MPEVIRPEICVIGGGAGGIAVATSAAAFGVSVALVEKGRLGGSPDSLLAQGLFTAARRAREVKEAPGFGIETMSRVGFEGVLKYVREALAVSAANESKERIAALGVRVIEGAGYFTDPETVAVGNDIEIKARRFVIATGSHPALPPVSGLDSTPFLTPGRLLELTAWPSHLIIVGAGRTGIEMAQAFRSLGAQVTVLDQAAPLAKEDPECAMIILDRLVRDRIVVRPNVSISLVGYGQSKVQVVLGGAAGGETIEGSHLLIAVGRRPYLEGLGVDRAGIKVGPRGIVVDRALRTSNKQVHAIGDAAGAPHFVQAATYDASLVIRSALFRLPVRANRDLVPRVISTEPALAHVGLSEPEARKRGYSIGVLRWPFVENDRVTLERAGPVGHIKVVTSRRGDVLGCTIVGPGAAESITPWSLAVSQCLHIRALAGTMVPYPTFAEVGKRAAMSYFSGSLTSPMVRRIIASLRRFR